MQQCHHHISTFTTEKEAALHHVAALAAITLETDAEDALSVAVGTMRLYRELDDNDQRHMWPSLQAVAPLVVDLYKVAAIKANDDDNPSFHKAMNGPERQLWMQACESEMESLVGTGDKAGLLVQELAEAEPSPPTPNPQLPTPLALEEG